MTGPRLNRFEGGPVDECGRVGAASSAAIMLGE
jgi:hypothetical protein